MPRFFNKNLFCSNPVEFGTLWSYGAPHAIKDMMAHEYFRGARMSLSPGDQMRLCRTEMETLTDPDNFVHEVLTVDVLRIDEDGVHLSSPGKAARPAPAKRPAAKVADAQKEVTAKQNAAGAQEFIKGNGDVAQAGDGTFTVMLGDNVVAEGLKTKEEATQIAIGVAPLPKAA